jgi:hypothetical protein
LYLAMLLCKAMARKRGCIELAGPLESKPVSKGGLEVSKENAR